MAWSGTGTFSRIVTTVSPATSGTTIDVADQNTYTADVTNGINACLAKNGENTPSSDLPMGGQKHTGVADGVAANDYAALGQLHWGGKCLCYYAVSSADSLRGWANLQIQSISKQHWGFND